MKKILLIISIIIVLAFPLFVKAQLGGPIVPCGGRDQNPCTLCDIFKMAKTIIDFLLIAIFLIATVIIVIGGIRILTSAGSPEHVDKGKKMITYSITGVLIALLSWIILAELFIALVGKQTAEQGGAEGFPWPWNEIQCVGGGSAPPSEEERMCTCGATSYLGNKLYGTAAECLSKCNSYCNIAYNGAPGCCGTDVYLYGCSGQPVDRCDERSAAGYCFGSNYYCQRGVRDQVFYTAGELSSFLDCMAPRLPSGNARDISSITDNSGGRCITNWTAPQCSGGTDSCTGTCCAHAQNSLHYGGTGCRGTSYAIDFATESAFTYIHDAAVFCANSLSYGEVDVVNEGNHIHLELDGLARALGCI